MTLPPILIPCEGAGALPHPVGPLHGLCSMCGVVGVCEPNGMMPAHDRNDIIAMLDRGDYYDKEE